MNKLYSVHTKKVGLHFLKPVEQERGYYLPRAHILRHILRPVKLGAYKENPEFQTKLQVFVF